MMNECCINIFKVSQKSYKEKNEEEIRDDENSGPEIAVTSSDGLQK